MRLKFKVSEVMPLVEHARAAKQHRPTYEQCYAELGDNWFNGIVKADTLYDSTKPALHLVKDSGVYLMSNGLPGLLVGDKANPKRSQVAYAVGLSSDAPYEKIHAVSGDDVVIDLPLGWFVPSAKQTEFVINFGKKKISKVI